jgi:hypothetical protein
MARRERKRAFFEAHAEGRSPQASAETLADTQTYEKMPNCTNSWASVLVEAAGIEPASASPPLIGLHA